MALAPSRKPDPSQTLQSGGCPRCGTRLAEAYKYCPNCAYRLRPDVLESHARPTESPTLVARVLALGGYLAFASLLLLVVLAGIQIFLERGPPVAENPFVRVPQDAGCLPLSRNSFLEVPAGEAIWGLYLADDPDADREPILRTIVEDKFLLGACEVTNNQFFDFLLARVRKSGLSTPERLYPSSWKRSTGSNEVRRIYDGGTGDFPVTDVDFAAALEFCAYVWEEVYDGDPNTVVDLPTAQEYVAAGRQGRLDYNFPWGTRLDDPQARVVLHGSPLKVRDPAVGEYQGFFGLVGNISEWVHVGNGPAAAGWSYRDFGYRSAWQENRKRDMRTPFSHVGFEPFETGPKQPHVGFRVAVRRAPTEPRFVPVTKGLVRHVARPNPVTAHPLHGEERAVPVEFVESTRTILADFEIADSEITNRQFLAFLIAFSAEHPEADLDSLQPESFRRPNPFTNVDPVFAGQFGDPRRIRLLYEGGRENQPVETVTLEQAQAYAEWLTRRSQPRTIVRIPTVGEYLRAGRGDTTAAYPEGLNANSSELLCLGRTGDEARPVSLRDRAGENPGIAYGLVGNLLEFVQDDLDGRLLLAGGCYFFPPEACTFDSFLDARWPAVDVPEEEDEEPIGTQPRLVYTPARTGFRVVRVKALF